EKAKSEKDWEDVVPFSLGTKRGKVWEGDSGRESAEDGTTSEEHPASRVARMEMPIELDLDDDDDLDEALDGAPERDLVDLAGILGMHNILNQPQYYNALKGKQQDDSTGTTFAGIIRAYEPKETPDEPENDTNVDECIKRLEEDDEDMKEVNVNNMKRISKRCHLQEQITKLISAACESNHITKLSMANTAMSDNEARGLIKLPRDVYFSEGVKR
ncbi:Tropomodulin, partial [Ostertagia ostertagi]